MAKEKQLTLSEINSQIEALQLLAAERIETEKSEFVTAVRELGATMGLDERTMKSALREITLASSVTADGGTKWYKNGDKYWSTSTKGPKPGWVANAIATKILDQYEVANPALPARKGIT